jgi:hypothetical protein
MTTNLKEIFLYNSDSYLQIMITIILQTSVLVLYLIYSCMNYVMYMFLSRVAVVS